MTCGSFSKTVAPGIRLGWVDAGRWRQNIATLKRVQGASTNAVLEHARRLILARFPTGTRVSDVPGKRVSACVVVMWSEPIQSSGEISH